MGTHVMRLVVVVACLAFGVVEAAATSAAGVTAGNGHSCAVTSGGVVWCWGANWGGQLGDGTNTSRLTPVPVSPRLPPLDVIAVTAGDGHTCAVTRAGAVWCWGDNRAGQLGDGTTTTRPTPVAVSGLGDSVVVAVAAGWGHTCAVTSAGAVWCWGSNADGQLGDGTTTDRLTPVVVSGLGNGAAAIAAAPRHTCAVTSAGGVWCWGWNGSGQLGDGTTTDALTPVAVSYLGSGVAAVTAGNGHTCAVTSAGAVWCWGVNSGGQLGDGTRTDALTPVSVSGLGSGVAALTSGDAHTCALTSAGAVWCWGSGLLGDGLTGWRLTPAAVSGLGSGVAAIGAAMNHTCAVTSAGAVWCWGHNDTGQLGDGTTTTQLTPAAVSGLASGGAAVTAGGWNTCAVTTTGAVKCWGWNEYGQVGDGTTTWRVTPVSVSGLGSGVTTVSASDRHTCALTSGGAVWCWGNNWWGQLGDGTTTSRSTPVAVNGLGSGGRAVTAGSRHTCAVTSAGAVWCWGHNDTGQLGDGTTTTTRSTPVAVSGLGSGVVAVTAGYGHTCALTSAGAVWCWGSNGAGRLGDGTTTDRSTPVAVSGFGSGATAIAAGSDHTCAVTSGGAVWCWGENDYGQLGDGTTTDRLTPVAISVLGSGVAAITAGSGTTCAVTSAGAAWCWGSNRAGQLGNGSPGPRSAPVPVSGLGSGVATIDTGGDHTCAVTAGGAVLCWGLNISSAPGDDRPLIRLTPVMVSGFAGAVPTVSSVAPPRGPVVGGTAVTITGTGFGATATVTIGGVAATNVVVVGATSITATTPPGTAGPAAVSVTTPGGTAALTGGFTYVPAPTVTGVSPAEGPTSGGTAVTITGTGFLSGATVFVGGVVATNVVVVSATSITATTPAHAAGAVLVSVTNPDAQTGSRYPGFTYVAAMPVLTWATPESIVQGTPLSATQLNATANVAGVFVYTPPSGTVLAVGTHTLSVTFTPTDTSNYVAVSKTVSLVVLPVSTLTVSPGTLQFAGTNTGGTLSPITAPQTATVSFSSAAALTWTASANQSWVQITNGSGTGGGSFTVGIINPQNVLGSATSASATITVTAAGATNSPQTVGVTLTLQAATANVAPFGVFETPADGATGLQGSFAVTGWALDDIGVDHVELWRDLAAGEDPTHAYTTDPSHPGFGKVYIANPLFVTGSRTDVEGLYPAYPFANRAGWGYLLLSWGLHNQGNGTYTLYAYAFDAEDHSTLLGTKTIAVDNAHATRPFGALDTPGYGETVAGPFWNYGWALTPNATPTCTINNGSVTMHIDSGPGVAVNYGDLRTDIAASFAGFSNGNNSGGASYLNTTTLSNGMHTIGWLVYDNCGRGDGIGSRFFTVLNGASGDNTGERRPSATGEGRPDIEAARSAARPSGTPLAETVSSQHAATRPPVPGVVAVRQLGGAWQEVPADSDGLHVIEVAQGGRIEVQLPLLAAGTYAGFLEVAGQRRPLPLGSSFDAKTGVYYWQPDAAFLGAFDLVFEAPDEGAVRLRVAVK